MRCRALWVSTTCFAIGLSGCSSPAEGESDGEKDAGRHDAAAADAAMDAKPDRTAVNDAARDTGSDGTAVTDATVDAEQDSAVVADAAPDGTAVTDATVDAEHDNAVDAEQDSAVVADAAADGTAVTDAAGTLCLNSDAGLSGIAVPAGTIATASGYYSTQTPAGVIDGTGWNAGAYTGWIDLTFPAPLTLSGIQLNAGAAPTATETYTVTGFQGSTAVSLGSWTDTVEGSCNCTVNLPPMLFAEGTYDAIQIAVQGGASWVAINEVSLLTASCPAPDGGVFGADSGAQGEAGAQDASAQDGAISEAAAPADAAEDSPEASPCALSTVAATPFPSLSGSASVTGTEETPTGAGVISGCFALVGNPSSGTITFSITSTGCAFSYVDANGKTFTSALSGAATFDGDTYECEESQASFGSQLESICPELDGLENGVGGIVSLVVTRSTGAVSVSRSCSDSGVGSCPIGNYPSGNGVLTNDLDLTGFLSCADAGSGAGGGPQIHCGTTSCSATSQVCCFQLGDELAEAGTLCIDPSADCSPGVAIACSGPESCLPEEVCCTGIGLGNGLQAACQEGSTCPAGSNGEILCESNADCPAGGVCIAGPFYGQCGPCTTDSQCPNGNCADGFCVCTSDSQCVSGQLCNGSDICVSM